MKTRITPLENTYHYESARRQILESHTGWPVCSCGLLHTSVAGIANHIASVQDLLHLDTVPVYQASESLLS